MRRVSRVLRNKLLTHAARTRSGVSCIADEESSSTTTEDSSSGDDSSMATADDSSDDVSIDLSTEKVSGKAIVASHPGQNPGNLQPVYFLSHELHDFKVCAGTSEHDDTTFSDAALGSQCWGFTGTRSASRRDLERKLLRREKTMIAEKRMPKKYVLKKNIC